MTCRRRHREGSHDTTEKSREPGPATQTERGAGLGRYRGPKLVTYLQKGGALRKEPNEGKTITPSEMLGEREEKRDTSGSFFSL